MRKLLGISVAVSLLAACGPELLEPGQSDAGVRPVHLDAGAIGRPFPPGPTMQVTMSWTVSAPGPAEPCAVRGDVACVAVLQLDPARFQAIRGDYEYLDCQVATDGGTASIDCQYRLAYVVYDRACAQSPSGLQRVESWRMPPRAAHDGTCGWDPWSSETKPGPLSPDPGPAPEAP